MNFQEGISILPIPLSESQLLERCCQIEGLSFAQLAALSQFPIPLYPEQRKGWTGQAVELALGASAKNEAIPDFPHLGIELKTLPINKNGKPAESTFVTSIQLTKLHHEHWETSQCYQKLKRILWVTLEGDPTIPFHERRLGHAFIWSPNREESTILANDWQELCNLIVLGDLANISAHMGVYLQIRPKAANAHSLCYGYDREGRKIETLPRGFYLRSSFTAKILSNYYNGELY